jgi:DNA primase
MREALILAVILRHPQVLPEVEARLERMELTRADLVPLHAAILRHAHGDVPPAEAVAAELGAAALEKLFAERHLRIVRALRPGSGADEARACLKEEFDKIAGLRGAARETVEAQEDIGSLADEGLTWRLKEAAEARDRALRAEADDAAESEVAENGLRIERAARDSARSVFEEAERSLILKRTARNDRGH